MNTPVRISFVKVGVLLAITFVFPLGLRAEPAAGVPLCTNDQQCAAMWTTAQDWVGTITGMRLRMATDTRLETFAPTSFGRMGGVVTKYPVGEGAWEIRLRLECYHADSCGDMRAHGLKMFNMMVGTTPMPGKLEKLAAEARAEASAAASAAPQESKPTKLVADELIKLADLRKRGVLTEAEFQKQKKALLGP